MGTVNVNRNVTDVFYRYKMPRIAAKVEGKGNGIKTVIVNMAEVAKAIGRPATYPTKYFGCELGAQTQFDYKVSHSSNKNCKENLLHASLVPCKIFVCCIFFCNFCCKSGRKSLISFINCLILCLFYRMNVSLLMVHMMQPSFKICWMVLFVNLFYAQNAITQKLIYWYQAKRVQFLKVAKHVVSMDHWRLLIRYVFAYS